MRLTRRGWTVVCVGALGTAMAAVFGARSLNAVVFPCVVALVAALVQVRRVDPPTVSRTLPDDGFPGDAGTVTLEFDTDSPFTATVQDALPSTVAGGARIETTVGLEPVSYEVRYRRRGLHTVGPVSFVAHDVLGLATRRFSAGETDDLLVYPRVHDLSARARRDLVSLHDTAESADRDEFDRLRPYVRGDSLRDVHWKSSAKREDLVVKEFTADNRSRTLTLVLAADRGRADEMAEAGATVVLGLLHAGVPVTLVTPGGTFSVMPGERETVLEQLARVGHGHPTPEDDEAAIEIHATTRGTTVRLGGTEYPFDRMVERRHDAGTGPDGTTPESAGSVDDASRRESEVAA
jgi:uncharacterized protein (DUF58 family)